MLNMRFSTAICVGAILSSTGAATDSTSPAPGSKVFSLVVDHKYHIFSFVELPRHSILSRIDHSAAASSLLRKQCASHSHDGSKATSLYMSKSNTSGDTLRQRILQGATIKLQTLPNDDHSSFSSSLSSITTATTTTTNISSSKSLQYIDAKIEDGEQETTYTYYIREGKRSGETFVHDTIFIFVLFDLHGNFLSHSHGNWAVTRNSIHPQHFLSC